MEFLLIVILSLLLFALWRGSRSGMERLRDELRSLDLEIKFLQEQLAALQKAQSASAASPSVAKVPPAKQAEPALHPTPPAEPPEAAAAQHVVPPVIAAFAAPAPVAPPEVARPVPAPVPAHPPVHKPMWPMEIPAAPKPPAPLPAQPEAKPPAPAPKPPEPSAEPVPAATQPFSFEEKLGTNWLNKIAIVSLALGVAFFLAVKLPTWSPGVKVLCGYSLSLALLAAGVWLERKAPYRIFARGCIGGGWAVAFFTTFAMNHISAARVLNSQTADLVLMLLVAAGMVGHSLRYRSQTVTGLAFLLGFGTLLTNHLETSQTPVVLSLTASAVLALALVVVTTRRHWAWLELTGLIAVYLNHWVWLQRVLPANHRLFAEFWPSTALIVLYWLIFRLAYVFRKPLDRNEENISSLSAVFNSIGVLGLLKFQAAHPEWACWALAAMGTIEMAMAFRVRSRRRQAFIVLSTIASVLLVASVPFKFHGLSWPVLWLLQAQLLAICGLRLGEPVFRRLGLLAGVVTGGVLAFHDVFPLLFFRLSYPDPAPHTSLTAALALAAVLYWTHSEVYPRRWPQIAENDREALALDFTSWLGVAAAATALWVALPELWLPLGWLALVLMLAFAGYRFSGSLLIIEADLLALCAAAMLAFARVWPLAQFRLDYPDPSHHPMETLVLALAAAAFWICSEVYPRISHKPDSIPSPDFDTGGWRSFTLPLMSWLGAAAAAAALWVVLPDLWVPIGWLALVLLIAFAAHRLDAAALTLEADALTALSAVVLAFHHVAPLAIFRLDYPDPSRHTAETAVLALAAAAFWIRSEVYRRLLPAIGSHTVQDSAHDFDLRAWEAFTLSATSWLGTAAAAAALWVVLPSPWVVVGWLALVVALGLAADGAKAQTLALEADLLAVVAACGLVAWNLWTEGWWDHRAPILAAVALLYAGMRRKTVLSGSANYVPSAYSWAASLLLAFVIADISPAIALTPVWAALGLALFEIGRLARKGFLRWQGFLLVALAIWNYLVADLTGVSSARERYRHPALHAGRFSLVYSLLLEVLILAAAGFWLLERTRNRDRCGRAEHIVAVPADALGTLSIVLWFAYRFPSEWVPVPGGEQWVTAIWAGMATLLMALAWLLRRRTFLVQAIALVVAVVARGIFLDLFAVSPPGFWHGALFHLGVTVLILLAALPFAFRLRGEGRFDAPTLPLPAHLGLVLRSPEQWFFFAVFITEVVALAVKLTSGHITIAWSLLGLAVFLFALAVGERSYRLAGLGLLLVSVAKIVAIDVWKLSPSDRYSTFIVLGLALLAVSFLYARFGKVIRKFL